MVMAEDERVKQNRLAQMKKLARLIGSYAKMTEIQARRMFVRGSPILSFSKKTFYC